MKKLRKLLSLSTALLLTTASVTSLNVSAVIGEEYDKGTIETVVNSFGEDAFAYYYGITETHALVIDDDGSAHVFYEQYYNTFLTVDNSKKLPIDEINEKIAPYYVRHNSDNGYTVKVPSKEDQEMVYGVLKSYDAITSIDEKVEVRKVGDSHWTCIRMSFDTDADANKAIEMFPELQLSKVPPMNKKYIQNSVYFPESLSETSKKESGKTIYDAMKKLSASGLKYRLGIGERLSVGEQYSSGLFNIYTAEAVKSSEFFADFDSNGKVELTDLTALSLYLIGDVNWNDEQVNNFDCNADGKTDIADLAHLKQYIMGEDVKLG
ncbi:MAG: dockerin type I repeat-containing protein [Oscillospiraceae bacterium]|nr:dockerin type I repeat-containing protein [Oscillospiraceae bacterium]